jgi:hypothetical protein
MRFLILLGGITLAFPLLMLTGTVLYNPSDDNNIVTTIAGGLVFGLFVVGAIFEIKRLVDQPLRAQEQKLRPRPGPTETFGDRL